VSQTGGSLHRESSGCCTRAGPPRHMVKEKKRKGREKEIQTTYLVSVEDESICGGA